jgi:hypothetical protein
MSKNKFNIDDFNQQIKEIVKSSDTSFFLGYHGTNLQSAKNIIENGLDVTKSGSEQGQARGKGFYNVR